MLSEAYEIFGCNTADVYVIAVNDGNTNAQCIQFDQTYGIEFPCISGVEGGGSAINNTYGIQAYPTYILIAPDHTIVEQDMWPINSVQTFINYFQSNGLQQAECGATLTAAFTADTQSVCQGMGVQFTDASTGSPTTWSWTFEGGIPATSTLQNPFVTYNTSGLWDVTLTVGDGTSTNTNTIQDFILASPLPVAFAGPDGETCVNESFNISQATASNYWQLFWTTTGNGILQYNTTLTPTYIPNSADAGATIVLTLNASGFGPCSLETAVSTMNLVVHSLPDVTLQPYDTACIEWQAFELTGGLPEGGIYTGTGVTNGWFDPAAAGIGTHLIAYTYTNGLGCENTALQPLTVTSCVGIPETEKTGFSLYPNPTSGNIHIDLKHDDEYTVQIIDTEGKTVFEKKLIKSADISLVGLENGIYLVKISSNKNAFIQKLTLKKE